MEKICINPKMQDGFLGKSLHCDRMVDPDHMGNLFTDNMRDLAVGAYSDHVEKGIIFFSAAGATSKTKSVFLGTLLSAFLNGIFGALKGAVYHFDKASQSTDQNFLREKDTYILNGTLANAAQGAFNGALYGVMVAGATKIVSQMMEGREQPRKFPIGIFGK